MISVLVLHEAPLVRAAVQQVLEQQPDLDVRATGSSVEAAAMVRSARPQVVVSRGGAQVRGELQRALGAGARHMVQVEPGGPGELAEALLAGASGVFTDRTGGPALVEAVRHVAAGRGWVSPELVPELVQDLLPYARHRAAARARLRDLREPEVRLLRLLAGGCTNAQIAAELHLAVSTVKDYVGALLARLGLTRAEAIALAVRADLQGAP